MRKVTNFQAWMPMDSKLNNELNEVWHINIFFIMLRYFINLL